MSQSRAVVRIDHDTARVLQFTREEWTAKSVTTAADHGHPHRSDVRADHDYFRAVSDALAGLDEVLVTGPHTALSDFRNYVEAHRPLLMPHIIGWEPVDHPTDGQLVALARRHVLKHDRLTGSAPLV